MNLELDKELFIEIAEVSSILNTVLKINNIDKNYQKCVLEANVSYKTISNEECFKSTLHEVIIDNDNLDISNIEVVKSNAFVIEGYGVQLNYSLILEYNENKKIEIIDLSEKIEVASNEPIIENTEEYEEIKEEYEEIKEEITNEYKEKLTDSLRKEKSIIVSKAKVTDNDFLSFFDSLESDYYSIKTISISSIAELNNISKEYNVPYQELLYGYDEKSRKVVFKIKK